MGNKTSRTSVTLVLTPPSDGYDRRPIGGDPVAVSRVEILPNIPLGVVAQEVFVGAIPESITAEVNPSFGFQSFQVRVQPAGPQGGEGELVVSWQNEQGLVCFAGLRAPSGHLSLSDLELAYELGYLKNRPQTLHLTPILGVGGGAIEGTWLWQWLVSDAPAALLSLGAGWIVGDLLPSPKKMLRHTQLTRRAKDQVADFASRGIVAKEQIRHWAASREVWTTHEGAKKLGVPHNLMEGIFTALGYKKRFEDQTWRLGLTEEYRQRRESWIEGEPTVRKVEPTE